LVSHKDTPTSTLLKHSQRVLLLGHQVSSVNTITITLAPDSTMELHQKRVGVSTSPAQRCRRRSTPSRMVEDIAGEPPRPQGWPPHRECKLDQLSSTAHKAHNLAITLKLELSYYSHLQGCAKLKNLITKHLGWLGDVFQCV
jgi:hypothetical protein